MPDRSCCDCGDTLVAGVNWNPRTKGNASYQCRSCYSAYKKAWDAARRGGTTPVPTNPIHPELARLRKEAAEIYSAIDRTYELRKEGFVYVIWHPRCPDLVKVGRSGDPIKRLGSANTWCPEKAYEIIHMEYFDDCLKAEAEIHQMLADCRIDQTEWFAIDRYELADLLQRVQERN